MIQRTLGRKLTIPLGARRIGIPIVLLVLLFCCCGPLTLVMVDGGLRSAGLLPTYTPAPTKPQRPTATVRPTKPPRPTAVPSVTAAPSVTPVPSWTAVPSATFAPQKSQPSPDVSIAESTYLLNMGEISTDLGQALTDLGSDSGAVGDNPSLILDDVWKIKAATHLAVIKIACQRIRELTPPPRYTAMHAELLTAAGHFENSCDLYAAGVDELSIAKLTQAGQEMSQGNAAVKRSTALMDQIAAGTSAASAPTQALISPRGPTVKSAANLRAGPGTTYPKTGNAAVGQALNIVARNPAGDWYQLASGAWIAASLVANPPAGLSIATVSPPTPAAAAPATVVAAPVRAAAVPTARGLPAAAASDCDCDHGNTLNCDDFESWDAQACYLRCKEITGQDIHGLDRDSDGNACEWEY